MVSTRAYEGEGGQRPSRRIASDLRAAIERGEYLAGHQLPSGSTLMARYGVARQTVQNAFDLLRAEGLVITRAGAGVFVKEHPPVQRLSPTRLSRPARKVGKAGFLADAASGGFTPTVETTVRVEAADERIADALDIEPGADVLVRDRVMRADGEIVRLAVSRLPRSITAGTAIEQENPGRTGIYGVLEANGHQLDHYAELVGARLARSEETSLFGSAPGMPVLTVTRIAYDQTGRPVEINDMVMAGDRYEHTYEIDAT